MQFLDQGIIQNAKYIRVQRILPNISLDYNANTNILEVIRMFSEAWGTFSAAKIVTCFHIQQNYAKRGRQN